MIEIVFLGDLILDVPEPDHWLGGIAPLTRAADLAIGHLEVPHTTRGQEMAGDVPAPGADPAHLAALARAGIGMVSLAGNHIADCGREGIVDTIAELDRLGIAHAGAGVDLMQAQRPAVLAPGDVRVVLLSYNCVGPEISWATDVRAGSNPFVVHAADGGPTRPQADLIEADPASLELMARQIVEVRRGADVVVVALHKGITHRPAELAPYERPVSHAAIDAGADIVVGHHAHIVRGIEMYRGKPVFHGLGNGVVVTNALSPAQDHPARAEWAERRKRMFGFEPDPAYTLAPFHPEAVNGMIGRCRVDDGKVVETAFRPIWFAPPGRAEPATGEQAQRIADYIDVAGQRAGLSPLARSWADEWVGVAG